MEDIKEGIYIAELKTVKKIPRIKEGIGIDFILKEIEVGGQIQIPRAFPLEISWSKLNKI